jgi:hypothetical protein
MHSVQFVLQSTSLTLLLSLSPSSLTPNVLSAVARWGFPFLAHAGKRSIADDEGKKRKNGRVVETKFASGSFYEMQGFHDVG